MRYPQRDAPAPVQSNVDQIGVTETAGLPQLRIHTDVVKPGSVLISLITTSFSGVKTRLHAPCLRIPTFDKPERQSPDLIVDFWRNGCRNYHFRATSSMYLVS